MFRLKVSHLKLKDKPEYIKLLQAFNSSDVSLLKQSIKEGADPNKIVVDLNEIPKSITEPAAYTFTIVLSTPYNEALDASSALTQARNAVAKGKRFTAFDAYLLSGPIQPAFIIELNNHLPTYYETKFLILSCLKKSETLSKYKRFVFQLIKEIIEDENYQAAEKKMFSPIRLSPLYFACEAANAEAIELVLEKGVNFEQEYLNVEKFNLADLKLFIKHGLDLDGDTSSQWINKICDTLNRAELHAFLESYKPTIITLEKVLQSVSDKSFNELCQNHNLLKNIPLLNDIVIYENMILKFEKNFFTQKDEQFYYFFKNKSFKTALQEGFNFSSPQFTKIMTETMFKRDRKSNKTLVSSFLLPRAKFLKRLLDVKIINFEDFLELLKLPQNTALSEFSKRHAHYEEGIESICSLFKPKNLKQLLRSKGADSSFITTDAIDMIHIYSLHEIVRNTKFSNINTIDKLHRFVMEQSALKSQKDFDLNQVDHFPQLLDIRLVKLPTNYGLKVAWSSQDLVSWGTEMDHCVGYAGYAEKAQKGKCILLSLTYKKEPKYCIEIVKGKIEQIQGKSHSKPHNKIIDQLTSGLKEINVLK